MIIIFYNLRKEMMRWKVTQKDIAKALKISPKSINEKINGHTEFTLSEIDLIQKTYFKDLGIEYLFKREV